MVNRMDQTDLLRIGVVGCGHHATTQIWPSLRHARVDIVYACDLDPALAERNRRQFGAEKATTDVREVVDDPTVQAVFVIGPAAVHHEVGMQVLEAGKHLFIEKPPGATLEQTLELNALATRSGLQCQVGFMKRFALLYRKAKEVAMRPEFGDVRLCAINFSHFRVPVVTGTDADWHWHTKLLAIHALDLARFFMGEPSEAYLLKRQAEDSRNTCVLTLLYGNGSSALLNLSSIDPGVRERVELSGANQLVTVRDSFEFRHWKFPGDGDPSMGIQEIDEDAVGMWTPEFASNRLSDSRELVGYVGEVVDFAESILGGRRVSPSIADGVAAMRMAQAVIEAPEGMSQLDLLS
jgi:predicted dehydrogenase